MTLPSKSLYRKIPFGYYKWPSQYNACPSCGSLKQKKNKLCKICRKEYRKPIEQPSDPLYRLIALTQEKYAIVDTEDYEWLMQWKWCAVRDSVTGRFYSYRKEKLEGKWIHIAMHNAILGKTDQKMRADHIEIEATLDNRRNNLRPATSSQNSIHHNAHKNNTSGCVGVHYSSRDDVYMAYITADKKRHHLGCFTTFESAKQARLAAEKIYHGEFSPRHKKI